MQHHHAPRVRLLHTRVFMLLLDGSVEGVAADGRETGQSPTTRHAQLVVCLHTCALPALHVDQYVCMSSLFMDVLIWVMFIITMIIISIITIQHTHHRTETVDYVTEQLVNGYAKIKKVTPAVSPSLLPRLSSPIVVVCLYGHKHT